MRGAIPQLPNMPSWRGTELNTGTFLLFFSRIHMIICRLLLLDFTLKYKGKVDPVYFKLSTTPWGVLGEWRYSSTHFLTSALDGGEWSTSRSGRFTPRERAPGTHWIRGRVGLRAVLDAVMNKISSPRRESNPRIPIVQPLAQRHTDRAVTALLDRRLWILHLHYVTTHLTTRFVGVEGCAIGKWVVWVVPRTPFSQLVSGPVVMGNECWSSW
jgi:hypothetical protein